MNFAYMRAAPHARPQIPDRISTRLRMDMSTFDQREDSFEKRYVHDEELRFKAEARRNKLVGLWAAEKLGKTGADAQAYADALVAAEVAADADARVVATVKKDFEAAGVDQSEHQIRRTMDEMLAKAKAEIQAGA
ncbi:hypothetical protein LMG27198_33280 [Methylocystis echinoides]|uniref:DUF1476 domain-containing protein n=2 Tax=Methylocystis echinoides TaxID=29468 RepID=A0A9W6GWQ6_9HYPH|nr:hypothetical protein LMG27198_33280 [Methylocystis echinoides]